MSEAISPVRLLELLTALYPPEREELDVFLDSRLCPFCEQVGVTHRVDRSAAKRGHWVITVQNVNGITISERRAVCKDHAQTYSGKLREVLHFDIRLN